MRMQIAVHIEFGQADGRPVLRALKGLGALYQVEDQSQISGMNGVLLHAHQSYQFVIGYQHGKHQILDLRAVALNGAGDLGAYRCGQWEDAY